jgi:predicted nuclease of predicted toxin-antitoxin system
MKFLVDNALSPAIALGLLDAGHDAIHVRDYDIADASDSVIFQRAADEDRIVLSADTDFGTILALRSLSKPSVILFRGATPRRPTDQVALLLANLPMISAEIENGAVAIIEPTRIRLLSLPIIRES